MKGFLLFLIAIVLSVILMPIGWVYSLFTFRAKVSRISCYYKTIAISIDQLGNVVCSNLFNDTLIKDGGYEFGDEDDTISMVLGVNKGNNTLTVLGRLIAKILNKIDKNHVENAIEKD